ncbi:MAG: HIT domain-containing protein, partial [Clostridia bacterium]|nr:HIT domain-containing protein [Clostridia bacterium]
MADCIFCKLANHEIEPDVVYENDLVCAFRDAVPVAPVHVLCVPKAHVSGVND